MTMILVPGAVCQVGILVEQDQPIRLDVQVVIDGNVHIKEILELDRELALSLASVITGRLNRCSFTWPNPVSPEYLHTCAVSVMVGYPPDPHDHRCMCGVDHVATT